MKVFSARSFFFPHQFAKIFSLKIAPPSLPPHHCGPAARDFQSSFSVEALFHRCHLDVQDLLHQQLLSSAMALMMTGAFSRNVSKLFSELKLVTDNLSGYEYHYTQQDVNAIATCRPSCTDHHHETKNLEFLVESLVLSFSCSKTLCYPSLFFPLVHIPITTYRQSSIVCKGVSENGCLWLH